MFYLTVAKAPIFPELSEIGEGIGEGADAERTCFAVLPQKMKFCLKK